MTRPPIATIQAPPFPVRARWLNVSNLRMEDLRGQPVLIEFWDFCRPNSLRTMPYMQAWAARYREAGLHVVGIHSPGFPPSSDLAAVSAAVQRLSVTYPVLVDSAMEAWMAYENLGWPARYLFDGDGHLFDYHYGEGAYLETEQAIRELLGDAAPSGELVGPLRDEDAPEAMLVAQSDDVAGPYCGPYEAGAVWAVLSGTGEVRVVGEAAPVRVDHPGAYELIRHPVSTAGVLELQVGDGVECHAVCFTPGLAG